MTKATAIKIEHPEQGVSREEYEAICKALGLEPEPVPQEEKPDLKK